MARFAAEETLQLKISHGLKKQIQRKALERNETLRALVLRALKDSGVSVGEEDLSDRRKSGSR